MANEYAADTVRSPRETPVLLTRWLRALQDAHRLRLGDARPDGFASLQWRRASSSERWLRLRILKDDASDAHALAVEFLLLAQRLLAGDAGECEQQVLSWLSDPTSLNATTLRLRQNCIGGHRFPGADADHMPLSLVMPCARHSRTWRRQDGPSDREPGAHESVTKKKQPQVRPWTLGVVVDFEGEFDGEFLALLQKASGDPLAKDNGLSDAFRTTYLQLNHQYPSSSVASFPVRLHVRLSSLTPSAESLRSLAATLCKWHTVKRSSFSINGMDIAAPSLNELLAAAPSLPFHKLLLCASSSLASRMDPLAKTTLPMDDTTLRLLLAKAQHHLLELEVCNVKIPNFDCIVQPFATGACLLQALRLKEFAMGVVTDGGIFAALADPYHLISQSLEELEIEQALYSAGGLSFWLQREASAMLLKNARLVKCLIRQATSMHPSTVYKGDGFRETCGRKILVPVPVASKRAFIAASPIKLPRDVAERIYEFAERSTTRDAHIDYRLITQDQLFQFKRDVDVWTAHKISPYESLPYGSYYS